MFNIATFDERTVRHILSVVDRSWGQWEDLRLEHREKI